MASKVAITRVARSRSIVVCAAAAFSCCTGTPPSMVRFPIQVDFVQNDDDPVDVAFIVRFDTATASATAELASRIPTYWSDRSSSRAAVVHSVLDSAGLLVVGKPEVVELGDGSGLVALADRLMQTNLRTQHRPPLAATVLHAGPHNWILWPCFLILLFFEEV